MHKAPLRVGRIRYTNVAPVETAFDVGAVERPAQVTVAPPATLNALLTEGELDAGPVSAAHYLANRPTLVPLGDCGIVARGAAISVVLVSRRPPALLDGSTVGVTRESATGRALVETILSQRYGVAAAYETVDDAAARARAGGPALLIGDDAIAIRDDVAAADVYDLGTAWTEWTGLPMVFALWAVRAEVAAQRPHDVAALAQAYARARDWGAAHRAEVVAAAHAARPRERGFYERYYATLGYVVDEPARAGLARFARALGEQERARVAG